MRNADRNSARENERKGPLGRLGVDGGIIGRWKHDMRVWPLVIGLCTSPVPHSCESTNETLRGIEM